VRRTVLISSLAVLVTVVAFSVFLGTRNPAYQASDTPSALKGKVAAAFSGRTLSGGHVNLASDRGDIVIVNFWASWCGPCVQEAPNLSTFAWHDRHDKVKVIGVVFDDTVAAATSFQTHYGSLYPTIVDPHGAIANRYGVISPPTTFVIDARGRVVTVLFGAVTSSQLQDWVARIRE
jgi:peroxiredoxin